MLQTKTTNPREQIQLQAGSKETRCNAKGCKRRVETRTELRGGGNAERSSRETTEERQVSRGQGGRGPRRWRRILASSASSGCARFKRE